MLDKSGNGTRIGGAGPRPMPKILGMAAAVSALALSACAGPTYGTDTPANQQLVEDLTGALSLAPKKSEPVDYTPRPGIVKPPSPEVLPPPQESVASASNPAWPESPEERLARVRAEATENQDNPRYRPNIIRDVNTGTQTASANITFSETGKVKPDILTPGKRSSQEQRREFQRRQQLTKQGSPTQRRYLSDPPTEYRQPAQSAAVDDLGVDEAKKERIRRRAAGAEDGGGWRRFIPWL